MVARALANRGFIPTLCAVALAIGACAPEDTPDESGFVDGSVLPRNDAAIAASEAGVTTDGSTPASAPDAGSDASASRDAASADAAAAVDSSMGQVGADANAAVDSATDASSPDATTVTDAGNTATATPSAGCGKSARPSGGRVSVAGDHNYTFPSSYDGKQPFPLLLGFHAAGNPIDQIENLTKGSDFETRYVRAFPKSKGSAWDYNTDIAKVRAMYEDLMANYCIDTSRVFATGHSSGAQLIVQILTPAHKADADLLKLKAVAPVAASRYGTVSRAIPVLYIQGANDNVRNSDGADVVKEFTTANACTASVKPLAGPTCMSSGKTVKAGCVQYDGCKVPTAWCSHDDPAYSNTNHGWPCFATKAMLDFFSGLP